MSAPLPLSECLLSTPQARHLVLQRLRQQAKENAEVMSSLEAAMLECASAQNRAKACLSLSNGIAAAGGSVTAGDPMDVAGVVGGERGGLEVDGSNSSGVEAGVGAAGGGASGGFRGAVPLPGAAGGRQGKGLRR